MTAEFTSYICTTTPLALYIVSCKVLLNQKKIFSFKNSVVYFCDVNIFNAGVATHDSRIGSWGQSDD
jgi:hypothetical protein